MASWLRSISFEVPESHFWPKAWDAADLAVDSGTCTNLTVGRITAQEMTSAGAPKVAYSISGMSAQCVLLAYHGTVEIRFVLADANLELSVGAQPVSSPDGKYVLPLGGLEVSHCALKMDVQHLEFKGSSMMADMLMGFRHRIESMAASGTIGHVACMELKKNLIHRSAKVHGQLSRLVMPLMGLSPSSTPATYMLPDSEVEDWSVYPVIQVLRKLLEEKPYVLGKLLGDAPPIEIPIGMTLNSTDPPTLGGLSGLPAMPMPELMQDSVKAKLHLGVARVHGLQSILGEQLLIQGMGRNVNVRARFEGVRIAVEGQLEVTIEPPLGTAPAPLQEDMNITLHLKDIGVSAQTSVEVSKPYLDSLFVDQIQSTTCLAEAAGGSNGKTGRVTVVDLVGEATPDLSMSATGSLERDLEAALQTTVQAVLPAYEPAVRALVGGVLRASVPQTNMGVGQYLAGMEPCPPTGIYQGPGDIMEAMLLLSALGLLVVGVVAPCLGGPCSFGERIKTRDRLPSRPLVQISPTAEPSSSGRALARVESWTSSIASSVSFSSIEDSGICHGSNLAGHAIVPSVVQAAFPFVTCAAVILFLYADLCLATVINFVFTAQDQVFTIGPALAFSVVIIALDAWQAGAYCIAGCIFVLSITWPFVKLSLLLWAWYVPVYRLGVEGRGKLLGILDEYGKWSLIDTWLGILALACYRLRWHDSEGGDLSFVVDPAPRAPFFVFVLAQVLSLALGHVASGLHRRSVEADMGGCDEAEDAAMCKPLYTFVPFSSAYALTAGLILSAVLIIVCAQLDVFEMVESGVLNLLLNKPGDTDNNVTSYSLIDLGLGITYGKGGDIGLIMVQFIFFFFAMFIPLALNCSIVVLLLAPMRLGTHRFLMDLCKALDAWAAFDVFALAVGVSRFEFGLFSTFLMHYNNLQLGCGLIKDYLQTECFHMECRFTAGFPVLALAALSSYFLPKYAFKVCEAAMDEARASRV